MDYTLAALYGGKRPYFSEAKDRDAKIAALMRQYGMTNEILKNYYKFLSEYPYRVSHPPKPKKTKKTAATHKPFTFKRLAAIAEKINNSPATRALKRAAAKSRAGPKSSRSHSIADDIADDGDDGFDDYMAKL